MSVLIAARDIVSISHDVPTVAVTHSKARPSRERNSLELHLDKERAHAGPRDL